MSDNSEAESKIYSAKKRASTEVPENTGIAKPAKKTTLAKSVSLDEAILWIVLISILPFVVRGAIIAEFGGFIQLGVALLALAVYKFRGAKLRNIGFRFDLQALKITIIFALVVGAFYAVVAAVIFLAFKVPYQPVSLAPAKIFWMIIVAPFAEELFFRAFLYTAIRKYYNAGFTLFLTAFLFMLMHPIWGVAGVENINHFFGGLVFGLAYEKSKSVCSPMLLHFLGNGSLILIALVLSHGLPLGF